jgi:2-polyprenyl-3-methyl-5-hydroxy-6-metoxy-1,4-benzoquinol methylase
VPYITENIDVAIEKDASLINTTFFIDHSNIPSMLQNVKVNTEWKLGAIRDGWEWLAFTFRDQSQIEHSEKEIEHFLAHSDKYVQDAYRRMDLLSANQKWAKYTNDEVDFIIKECQLRQGDAVLDLGCGTGRHSFALAQQGIDVTAVDYIDEHFNKYKGTQQFNVRFFCDDSRYLTSIPEQKFNAVICLYDVIGSYVSQEDNIKILRQIYNHLEKGGYAIISVMNYDAVPSEKIDDFSFEKLQLLEPSQTMETTGDIFNSDLMLVDKESQVLYRKEQFERGEHLLPVELVVRDRRFRKNEIVQMCVSVGFEIVFSRYVRAGDWNDAPLLNTADTAKEILIKCRK